MPPPTPGNDAIMDGIATGVHNRVTQVTGAKTHVVFRLRQLDDTAPWVTEVIFFLFNAQGNVLQVARGATPTDLSSGTGWHDSASTRANTVEYFGERNLSIQRKDAAQKEVAHFSLDKLHQSVEVVGCLVSYMEDEIARRPLLNEFQLSCDLCDAFDDSEFDSALLTAPDPDHITRALEYVNGSKTTPRQQQQRPNGSAKTRGPTYVILCKFFRDRRNRREWFLHVIGESGVVRCPVNSSLAECMQVFLLDIIPEIEIPNRNGLTSVTSICAALTCDEFLEIERYFPDEGLHKTQFARIILFGLLLARPELRHVGRAAAIVALLFELFEQIDINGDAMVDWEEFTTFCMSVGLIATSTHDWDARSAQATLYQQEHPRGGPAANWSFPYQLSKIRTLVHLKRVAVVQHKSPSVMMYDPELVLLHEFNCCEKLGLPADCGLEVMDIDHLPVRNALAIATSDENISIWNIINAATGAYVLSHKLASRYPPLSIKWCAGMRRLFVSGAKSAHLWDVDAQRAGTYLRHPGRTPERVVDIVELANAQLFATASFDHKIAVWDASSTASPRVAFELLGHAQAPLTLDYNEPVLLSSGFEFEAYCWSVPTRTLRAKLGGHHRCLIGAKFVPSGGCNSSVAVTGDQGGHFRLWDVSRCLRGFSTDLVSVLQVFDVQSANSSCGFRTFACGFSHATEIDSNDGTSGDSTSPGVGLADVLGGNFRLVRFRAVQQTEESRPPRNVTYNAVTNTFVGVVGSGITVWNGNSGEKLEEPVVVRDAEICGIAFDSPRERKLFVATNDGFIRLYNPVTGALLMKSQIHDGIISSLLFCPHANCLISTGYDRSISVSLSQAGKTDLEVLRTVENAHDACITASAFSSTTQLVATADEAGAVHIYDFANMYLLFRCAGHRSEVRSLHFHCSAPLLVSGDAAGVVLVWAATTTVSSKTYTNRPLLMLLLGEHSVPMTPKTPKTPKTPPVRTSRSGDGPTISKASVMSLCSTPESIFAGNSDGVVYRWDLRALIQVAHKRGVSTEWLSSHGALSANMFRVDSGADLNSSPEHQQLRMRHKLSILRLQGDDRHQFHGLAAAPRSAASGEHLSTLGCLASASWRAHDAAVAGMGSVPFPGALFSFSRDCAVRVWDGDGACLGQLSTSRAAATQSKPALAWKFTRHAVSDEGSQHMRIAAEVVRKHAKQKNHEQQAPPDPTETLAESDYLDLVARAATPAPQSPLKRAAPFTVASLKAGMQVGLFGPQELASLHALERDNPSLVASLKSKATLAPLGYLSVAEREDIAKARVAASVRASEIGLDGAPESNVMRSMKNYPLELQRRRAQQRMGASLRALDMAPSPFLCEQLGDSLDSIDSPKLKAPKSTPKTKHARRSVRVDTSATVARNLSLPALPEPAAVVAEPEARGDPEPSSGDSPEKSTLSSSASAPALASRGEAERANISRKMRLYEELAQRPSATTKQPSRLAPVASSYSFRTQPQASTAASSTDPANAFGPHYTTKQVLQFGALVAQFDEDLSGDLDPQEWVRLIQGSGSLFAQQDIDKLFRAMDRDDSGKISLHEILPAIFSRATPEQLQRMRQLILTHTQGGT